MFLRLEIKKGDWLSYVIALGLVKKFVPTQQAKSTVHARPDESATGPEHNAPGQR